MTGAIVLAAGRSGRMGTQKLLLPLGGKPVIAHIVDELLLSPLHQIIVVTSTGSIRQALANRDLTFVSNPDPEGDMLSSIRCGLRSLSASCTSILVALGDQPGVTHQLVNTLISVQRRNHHSIVVPVHNGKRGHPVLFAARYREEVLTRHDEIGLHGLLNSHPADVISVPVFSAGTLADMDTPADYERQKSAFSPANPSTLPALSASTTLLPWGKLKPYDNGLGSSQTR